MKFSLIIVIIFRFITFYFAFPFRSFVYQVHNTTEIYINRYFTQKFILSACLAFIDFSFVFVAHISDKTTVHKREQQQEKRYVILFCKRKKLFARFVPNIKF